MYDRNFGYSESELASVITKEGVSVKRLAELAAEAFADHCRSRYNWESDSPISFIERYGEASRKEALGRFLELAEASYGGKIPGISDNAPLLSAFKSGRLDFFNFYERAAAIFSDRRKKVAKLGWQAVVSGFNRYMEDVLALEQASIRELGGDDIENLCMLILLPGHDQPGGGPFVRKLFKEHQLGRDASQVDKEEEADFDPRRRGLIVATTKNRQAAVDFVAGKWAALAQKHEEDVEFASAVLLRHVGEVFAFFAWRVFGGKIVFDHEDSYVETPSRRLFHPTFHVESLLGKYITAGEPKMRAILQEDASAKDGDWEDRLGIYGEVVGAWAEEFIRTDSRISWRGAKKL